MPLRPTPDALRERAFSVVDRGVVGAAVLDLFAGTGAIGLEALSRGAATAVFVEKHRAATRLIRDNLAALEVDSDRARVLTRPVSRAISELARKGEGFDLAWADPPFERWQEGLAALQRAAELGVLGGGATACLECPQEAELEVPGNLEIERELSGGASRLVLFRVA
jgi:16S rRNA (guanine966-N2)-methyltransferase